jgi:hypothetical protein
MFGLVKQCCPEAQLVRILEGIDTDAFGQQIWSAKWRDPLSKEENGAAIPCDGDVPMVGARGLEPLTPTVSKNERSVIVSDYDTSGAIKYQPIAARAG